MNRTRSRTDRSRSDMKRETDTCGKRPRENRQHLRLEEYKQKALQFEAILVRTRRNQAPQHKPSSSPSSSSSFFFFFFSSSSSSLNLLIGWQLSIWICCSPFSSLLYNYQLLCFWRLALSIVVEVVPLPFFRILLLPECLLLTRYV